MGSRSSNRGVTILEVIVIALILVVLVAVFMPVGHGDGFGSKRVIDAMNVRQIALAGLMYGGDYDDRTVPTVNGWLCRMQDVGDKERTVNCPASGTQAAVVTDAAGAQRTDTWVMEMSPYIKSRRVYVDPSRYQEDTIFSGPPLGVDQPGYRRDGPTYRNQNLYPYYGYNYMFLSPLHVQADRLNNPNPASYATASVVAISKIAKPEATVFFVDSQYDFGKSQRGFFAINAPGMWTKFLSGDRRSVAFWRGTAGSGDWSQNACPDLSNPCKKPVAWQGFVSTQYNDGANVTFVDGHVKYMKASAMAAGTNYLIATASTSGSGAVITDLKHYLWDLN